MKKKERNDKINKRNEIKNLAKTQHNARADKILQDGSFGKIQQEDHASTCKTHHMQDGARGSCKYLQDILARSSKSIFQVLARLSKTNVWQDGARWSYKILQE